jgi:predicted metal-dependent enzyme (double-stranded beta helix superfamily)
MFQLQTFIQDCLTAVRSDPTHVTVQEVMKRAFADPDAVMAAVGKPTESGLVSLYQSPELTVLNVVWKPGMAIMPHNHRIWALIGVYQGQEDNVFWRRLEGDADGRIEPASTKSLFVGDVMPLGKDIIHSVTNPSAELTGAIHVYGGPFFEIERSEWDPDALTERAYDLEKAKAMFTPKVEAVD